MIRNIIIKQNLKQTPKIKLTARRVEPHTWYTLGFYKHHYLTQTLNKSCKCILFEWNNNPIAFIALLNSPRKGMPYGFSISRLVIMPDYQGLGLSTKIIDFCGAILKQLGEQYVLYIKTIHEKMGNALEKSKNWMPTAYNGKTRNYNAITSEGKKYQNRLARKSFCFKYVGQPLQGFNQLLLPIKILRDNKNNT